MKVIKNIITGCLFGILIGLLGATLLILSPLLMCMYILDWAVRFEDDMMTENYVYDSTIYVGQNGIEWESVKP